jgi:hypothetical protein
MRACCGRSAAERVVDGIGQSGSAQLGFCRNGFIQAMHGLRSAGWAEVVANPAGSIIRATGLGPRPKHESPAERSGRAHVGRPATQRFRFTFSGSETTQSWLRLTHSRARSASSRQAEGSSA